MEQFSNGTAEGQIIEAWNRRTETDRLVEALEGLLPRNLGEGSFIQDDALIPVDMTMGEIRKARALLSTLSPGADT